MEARGGGARKGPFTSVVLFVFKGYQYQRPEKGSSQYIPSVVLFELKAKLREDARAELFHWLFHLLPCPEI